MRPRQGCLAVKAIGRDFEIDNGLVLVRLVLRDGGYAQEFYAADDSGRYHLLLSSLHKTLIPASEHRVSACPMISGERFHLFGVCRESLRMGYSSVCIRHPDPDKVTARLTGALSGHDLSCELTVESGSSVVGVCVRDRLPDNTTERVVEYSMSSYAFLPGGHRVVRPEDADCVWAPALRPGNDHVIGDDTFHTPAAAIQTGQLGAALIPDVQMLLANRPMPAVLDIDFDNGLLQTPLLSYGFCGCEPEPNGSWCRHDITMSRRLREKELVYGYYLLLDGRCGKDEILSKTASFLWQSFPARRRPDLDLRSGRSCSSVQQTTTRLPDAQGIYAVMSEGIRLDSGDLRRRATQDIHTVLATPQEDGLFRLNGLKNLDSSAVDGSADPSCAPPDQQSSGFDTAWCSTQCYWLLRIHEDLRTNNRILSFCRCYGDRLLKSMLRSGAIPSRFNSAGVPTSTLRSSAQTSASALFLAALARATGIKKYLQGAEKGLTFVTTNLLGSGELQDYTCLDADSSDMPAAHQNRDPHTGMFRQGTWASLWSAAAALELYELTGSKSYLSHAKRFLDRASLFQCVCNLPWDRRLRRGMCVDGNWKRTANPELTAEFARYCAAYGAAAGKRQYLERAAAALQAAFRAPGLAPESAARVKASAEAIQRRYGVLYVDLSGRWAVSLFGVRLHKLVIAPRTIEMEADLQPGDGRVVFGRIRAKELWLVINDLGMRCKREDMEAGIRVPGPGVRPEWCETE